MTRGKYEWRTPYKKKSMSGVKGRTVTRLRQAQAKTRAAARNQRRMEPGRAPPGVAAARGNYMYGRLGPERKWLDTSLTQTPVSSTGNISIASLNLIDSGTGASERVGKRVTLTSIAFRGVAYLNATATAGNTADVMRMIVYLDKQCNGGAAAVTDILGAATYNSFNNLDNSDRFTTLFTRKFCLNARGYSGTSSTQVLVPIKHYYSCKIPVELHENATTTISDVKSMNVGVLLISQDGLVNVEGQFRVRFTDA